MTASDISRLRELLSDPIQDREWNDRFCDLLLEVYEERYEEYLDIWLPYCEKHKEVLQRPIGKVDSLDELEEWACIAPFGSFVFDVYCRRRDREMSHLGEDCLAIVRSPLLVHVRELSFWGCSIGDEGCIALAESPYVGHLQTLSLYDDEYEISEVGYLALCCSLTLPEEIRLQFLGDVESYRLLYVARELSVKIRTDDVTKEQLARWIWQAKQKEEERLAERSAR